MNRLFLCFIVLSSCSSIDYGYFDVFLEGREQSRVDINKDYIEKAQYSFIKVKQGKQEATFVLLSSNNGIETWIGSNYERIYTFNGLIIRTFGLDQDINFSQIDFENVISNFPNSSFSTIINLTNPKLDAGLLKMTHLESFSDPACRLKVTYQSLIKHICTNSKNTFCYDEMGRPIRTQQMINPASKEFYLEFYYKF